MGQSEFPLLSLHQICSARDRTDEFDPERSSKQDLPFELTYSYGSLSSALGVPDVHYGKWEDIR